MVGLSPGPSLWASVLSKAVSSQLINLDKFKPGDNPEHWCMPIILVSEWYKTILNNQDSPKINPRPTNMKATA